MAISSQPAFRTGFKSIFSLTMVALALFGAVAINDEAAESQAPIAILNEQLRYSVDLGDEIRIFMDADFTRKVVEVKARYTPRGVHTISSYVYPEFEPGERVKAFFAINTRAPSYIPPGAIFDMEFEFTFADGSTSFSQRYVIEHLDAQRDWRRIAGDDLELIYYGIAPNTMARLHEQVNSRLPRIKSALGVAESAEMRAVIFPNLRELTRYGPKISEAATHGTYFGGFAYAHYNMTIMASPSAEVLTHELTHLIFDKAFPSPLSGRAPAWLNEGIASHFETGTRKDAMRNFAPHLRAGRTMSFRKMNAVPSKRLEISVFYSQSADFVGFLTERYGEDQLGRLVSQLNQGDQIDDAMKHVFGGDLTALENEWRISYGLAPAPTPEPTSADPFGELPPTIPGLPTLEPAPDVKQEVASNPRSEEPQPTPLPTASPVPSATPTASLSAQTSSEYFTGRRDQPWPQPNVTMLIVFALLGLGAFAMLWLRTRS